MNIEDGRILTELLGIGYNRRDDVLPARQSSQSSQACVVWVSSAMTVPEVRWGVHN